MPSKSLGGGIKESKVPLELVSSPLVSAGVDGGKGYINSTELGTDNSDIPEVVAGGVGGPETEVGGVGGRSDVSEFRDLLYFNEHLNFYCFRYTNLIIIRDTDLLHLLYM